ncbi:MAG TPA: hypothetical protein VFT74_03720, partial [Isosphaeraceae bacterium]|nr:hypothetical protein [Isosphaeraceae bacterium]
MLLRPRSPALARPCVALAALLILMAGCKPIPLTGGIQANANVDANFQGNVTVNLPTAPDPGPMVPVVVEAAAPGAPQVALIDVDGLILNQNLTGLYSVGENPVAAFREKLKTAAADPRIRAVVLRVNSPGG